MEHFLKKAGTRSKAQTTEFWSALEHGLNESGRLKKTIQRTEVASPKQPRGFSVFKLYRELFDGHVPKDSRIKNAPPSSLKPTYLGIPEDNVTGVTKVDWFGETEQYGKKILNKNYDRLVIEAGLNLFTMSDSEVSDLAQSLTLGNMHFLMMLDYMIRRDVEGVIQNIRKTYMGETSVVDWAPDIMWNFDLNFPISHDFVNEKQGWQMDYMVPVFALEKNYSDTNGVAWDTDWMSKRRKEVVRQTLTTRVVADEAGYLLRPNPRKINNADFYANRDKKKAKKAEGKVSKKDRPRSKVQKASIVAKMLDEDIEPTATTVPFGAVRARTGADIDKFPTRVNLPPSTEFSGNTTLENFVDEFSTVTESASQNLANVEHSDDLFRMENLLVQDRTGSSDIPVEPFKPGGDSLVGFAIGDLDDSNLYDTYSPLST